MGGRRAADTEVNVALLIAAAPGTDVAPLRAVANRLIQDVEPEIEAATGLRWDFYLPEPMHLTDSEVRRPSDFLDEACLRMVEGPFDLVFVLTDVGLSSRGERVVAGLASEISHVAVISTRKLLITPRGKPIRTLQDPSVRSNAAALALHLLGHLLGLDHTSGERGGVMAPFRFDEERQELPMFSLLERRRLHARSRAIREHTEETRNALATILFHFRSTRRHIGAVLRPLWRNGAVLLPLSLPSLATAAVTPTFILVFTAEIWDVGLNMQPHVAWTFAIANILAATWYLLGVQNLFFPHKERRLLTEHLAALNVTILLSILLAVSGLFLMVSLLMLFIETYIFPPQLISEWPTLEDPVVTPLDKFLLAAFISSVGVLTGALAGGLESRTLIRHLALFEREP